MDELAVDELGVDELEVDELEVDELGVDELGVDELGVDELGVDEFGVDELGVDELGVDELGVDGWAVTSVECYLGYDLVGCGRRYLSSRPEQLFHEQIHTPEPSLRVSLRSQPSFNQARAMHHPSHRYFSQGG